MLAQSFSRRRVDLNRVATLVAMLMSIIGCGESPSSLDPTDDRQDVAAVDQPLVRIAEPYPIVVTGGDYQWQVDYPGIDGEPETNDDVTFAGDVHIPAKTEVVLLLRSADFIYTLELPDLGLREIAVPNLEFRLQLPAVDAGIYELRGDQMCGYAHKELLGQLIVQPSAEFSSWMIDASSTDAE